MSESLKWYGGTEWWDQIGLRYSGLLLASRHDHRIQQGATELLRKHPPLGFAGDAPGETLTLEELAARMRRQTEEIELAGEAEREVAARERSRKGREQVEAALSDPALAVPIEEGRWAGFTQGEAIAWCWNLFQYEPRGFIAPGSQLRMEATRRLEAGEIPEVFRYPERARELADQGITPKEYRRFKEATGAKTFTQADVTFGGGSGLRG